MISGRVPRDLTPNDWSRALERRRAAGAPLLDLTEANPTRVGLAGLGPAERAAFAAAADASYEPDPRGDPRAREAIAAYYAERGAQISPAQIVLTSGTSEGYAHLFRLLADPGQRIAVPRPSYPLFEPLARAEGIEPVPYRLEWNGRWTTDLESVDHALERGSRAIVVVQPHHPTGAALRADEAREIERRCARHGAALIADEVFLDFARPDAPPIATLAGERGAPTFVMSGLSKACGMPQLKLGWIAACGPADMRERSLAGLEWLADLFLSVGAPVQRALPALLEARRAFQPRVRERIVRNLATLAALRARRPELDVLAADGGWTAVLRMPARAPDERWALALLERGVVVHPGHFYELDEGAHLVVSLIVEEDRFARGIAAIGEALASG